MRRDVYALLCQFQFTPLHERQRCSFRNAYQLYYFNSRLCMRGNDITVPVTAEVFQFTPLHERQQKQATGTETDGHFNSRLCMRGNIIPYFARLQKKNFNSRLCMKGNNRRTLQRIGKTVFQFTPLHERQQSATFIYAQSDSLFQFTPLHERQRCMEVVCQCDYQISIHASA